MVSRRETPREYPSCEERVACDAQKEHVRRCSPSGDPVEWDGRARGAVSDMVRKSVGREASKSLYGEMRARRSLLHGVWNANKPGRCVRGPWCVLTVCFWSAGRLSRKLGELPKKLRRDVACWVWVSREPDGLWPGYPDAATCVLLMAGVPGTCSVRRVAELLLDSAAVSHAGGS